MRTETAISDLKKIEHITVGIQIKASMEDNTVIGVNVSASSAIRKQAFTLPFMQKYCEAKGWTITDKYPCTDTMQIYFN
jgi:hypothetical protein